MSGHDRTTPTLYLGCPVWSCRQWRGSLLTKRATRDDWLIQYSSVFRTVEGNSTFYAVPSLEIARRWANLAVEGFEFSLKMPGSISHDRRLIHAETATAQFLDFAMVLQEAGRLGPSFLQLPPDFGADQFQVLKSYLQQLPQELRFAVEVRHLSWFDHGAAESELDGLLRELNMEKVLFDSRALYSRPPGDEIERTSQSRKPKTPLRTTVTGQHPFLRFVGRNRLEEAMPWIHEWAPVIANWLAEGYSPYVFTHSPDDTFAPDFARAMYSAVRQHAGSLPDLSVWPGEEERANMMVQRTLFD